MPVLPFLILNILAIAFAVVYSVFVILGSVSASWYIFAGWLVVLSLFNGLFLYSIGRNREKTRVEIGNTKKESLSLLKDLDEVNIKFEKSRIKNEAILSSIGDGIVFITKDGKISFVNKRMEEMTGFKSKRSVGRNFFDVFNIARVDGRSVPEHERLLYIALSTKERTATESLVTSSSAFYLLKKDGGRFPVSEVYAPVILDGELLGVVGVFRDITLEIESERIKTEFVSIASHQLRTPLSIVNWYTEMLLDGDAGEVNKKQRGYLNEVYHGNQRMVELVNALLNVARLEGGIFSVNPSSVDLENVISELLDDFLFVTNKKEINIKKDFGKDIPRVQADIELVRIIFQNIISNAIKYTLSGGEVSVSINYDESAQVDRCDKNKKGGVLVKVKDTGIGISDQHKGRIFEKLFRADNARETDPDGTGLGLYIAKSILIQTSGEIWFDSEEGKGTTFYVLIPIDWMRAKTGTKHLEG